MRKMNEPLPFSCNGAETALAAEQAARRAVECTRTILHLSADGIFTIHEKVIVATFNHRQRKKTETELARASDHAIEARGRSGQKDRA